MANTIVHPGTMAYPEAPPTWETKAVKSLEPMNLTPAWATQKDITNQLGGKSRIVAVLGKDRWKEKKRLLLI